MWKFLIETVSHSPDLNIAEADELLLTGSPVPVVLSYASIFNFPISLGDCSDISQKADRL